MKKLLLFLFLFCWVTSTSSYAQTLMCIAKGYITQEYWANIGGASIAAIPVNATPTYIAHHHRFETPSNLGDDYGQRIRGYICAPVSGNYTFYIAGDDNSELWLSTSHDPAAKQKIAFSTSVTNSREWDKYASQQSAVIMLQANTKYYIEALHKEGTGSDNLAVGWEKPGTSVIEVIPGSVLSPFDEDYEFPSVSITSPAAGTTFTAPATINVAATISDRYNSITKVEFFAETTNGSIKIGEDLTAPYTMTWLENTAGTYSILAFATDYVNTRFQSKSVSFTVKDPPAAYCFPQYRIGCGPSELYLINNFIFNTLVNNNSGCGNGGYSNYPATGTFTTSVNRGQSYNLSMQSGEGHRVHFGVWIDYNNDMDFEDDGEFVYASPTNSDSPLTSTVAIPATASLGATRLRVRSNVFWNILSNEACGSMTYGEAEDYTITIGDVAACAASGFIAREQYSLTDLAAKPVLSTLTAFESSGKGDNYAARILGYICPPLTGNYTFWISGDDATRLILSPDANPENAQLVAYSTSRTNFREYKKYASQKSAPIYLEAGKKYYIEAQHAEFWAGDHVTVAWQLPNGTFEGPIPGSRLSPYISDGQGDAALAASTQKLRMQMQQMNEVERATTPKGLSVSPNPFSDKTNIDYVAAEAGELQLEVFSTTGKLVRTLYKGRTKAGLLQQYVLEGSGLAAGVYVCRVILNNKTEYKRIMLLK